MPQVIVIRLHPDEPTTGADFTNYLTKPGPGGWNLKIEAWDASLTKPKVNVGTDTPIGQVTFDPNPAVTLIAQHWLNTIGFPPAAVATAVLEITTPPAVEYAEHDIVLRVTRGTTLVGVFTVDYNVAVVNVGAVPAPSPPPASAPFPSLDAAIHLALPSPLLAANPNDAVVTLPKDGSPPSFDDLKAAVEKVLSQDPGGATDLKTLTPAQCHHIAFEIAWNRHIDPVPEPSSDLETMYTTDAPGFDDKAYQRFDAELLQYRATHDAKAELLAGYIYSMAAALVCEQKSLDAARAGLRFPIQPGVVTPSGKIEETEVILKN